MTVASPPSRASSPRRLDPSRFPALRRLLRAGPRQVPFVQQLEESDCGAACLAMVLAYHGRTVPVSRIRDEAGIDRDGSDVHSLLRAGERFGLRGRGLRIDLEDLEYLPAATILHWEFRHFVVFERVTPQGAIILDPARGRRQVSLDQLRRSLTGVAIELHPGEGFAPGKEEGQYGSIYWRYLLEERSVLLRVAVASGMIRLFALSLPLLIGFIVDRVVPRGDHDLLLVVGVGLAMMAAFQLLAGLVRGHLLLQLRSTLDVKMTLGFLEHLFDLPFEFFQRRSAGDLTMRVNSNTFIRHTLTTNTLSGILDGTLVLIYLGLILALHPTMGALVLGLGVLQISVYIAARSRTVQLNSQELEAQAAAQTLLVQLLSGVQTLKMAGTEQRAVEQWSGRFVDEINLTIEKGQLQVVVDAIIDTLRMGSSLLVLGYGATLVLDGSLSLGMMLAVNALAVGFLSPLGDLVLAALRLQTVRAFIERIDDVLRAPTEQAHDEIRPAHLASGRVRLEGVSFGYGKLAPLVVRDVSLEIEPGSFVAIVGRSGSGKSTLVSLLTGLYVPRQGQVLFDERPLHELDLRSLRQQLGVVIQHPYVFGTSIRANIALGAPSLSIARIREAARLACLDDVIARMPMGYETTVGPGGSSISGGERQRLALARALVRRPTVLILDEATSALDARTELEVARNLETLGCTRIVVAHRLSTIVHADQIIVMDGGRIVEQGTHEQLLARNGIYAELVGSQMEGS